MPPVLQFFLKDPQYYIPNPFLKIWVLEREPFVGAKIKIGLRPRVRAQGPTKLHYSLAQRQHFHLTQNG